MARVFNAQTNFSSGELDPKMRLRTDTGAFGNGAERLRNVQLLNTGGAMRRGGTLHRAQLAGRSRLRQFEFDDDETYVFAFQGGQVQIFASSGAFLQTLSGARWTEAQIRQLTFAQLGDTMVVLHRAFRPHVIRRTSLTTFALSDFAFAQNIDGATTAQPFFKYQGDDVTMTASAESGSVTLTCSHAFFVNGHIGTRIKMFDAEVVITAVASPTSATGQVMGRIRANFDIDPVRTTKGSKYVTLTLPYHGLANGQTLTIGGSNDVGGISAGQINGTYPVQVLTKHTFRINTATSAASPVNADLSTDGGGPSLWYEIDNVPIRNWREQVFSDVNGWPGCAAFHQQRLWLGGAPELPSGLWGSEVGEYFSFDLGMAQETAGVFIQVGQENGVSVRHLVSGKHLQIFTEVGEYYIPQGEGQAITPLAVTTKKESPFGIGSVNPISLDGATVFLQKSGTAVREFIYSEAERGYSSNPLSLAASHVLAQPYDLAVIYGTDERPEQYAFLVNGNGTVAVFHSARVERLAGWTVWTTAGAIDSACAVNGTLWLSALRDGAYWLEELAADAEAVTVDAASVYSSGVATKTWNVGSRYAGKSVNVLARKAGKITWSLGRYTVGPGGELSLRSAHTEILVGFDFPLQIRSLSPNIQTDKGPLLGEKKRIVACDVGLHTALGLDVDGERVILRQVRDDPTADPVPYTGYQRLGGMLGYSAEPFIEITQSDPLPLTVLGLIMKVSI